MLDGRTTHVQTGSLGTPTHAAPELLREGRLASPVDVYAFGVLGELHAPFANSAVHVHAFVLRPQPDSKSDGNLSSPASPLAAAWELVAGEEAWCGQHPMHIILQVTQQVRADGRSSPYASLAVHGAFPHAAYARMLKCGRRRLHAVLLRALDKFAPPNPTMQGARPPPLPDCPPRLAALMAACWHEDPACRWVGWGGWLLTDLTIVYCYGLLNNLARLHMP